MVRSVRFLLLLVFIAVVVAPASAQKPSGELLGGGPSGTITDGGVFLTFMGISDGLAARTNFNINSTDNAWQIWFYYRLSGDTQEFALPSPMTESYVGDTAVLEWTNLFGSGIDANLELVIEEAGAGGSAGVLTATMAFENPGVVDDTINIYLYVDFDVSGSFGNDAATLVNSPDWIRVTDGTTPDEADMRGGGAGAYQVDGYAALRGLLEDDAVTSLNNSGLPFGPGQDFTGALQWVDLDLFAEGSTTVQATLAYNIPAPAPADPTIIGGPLPPPSITDVTPDSGSESGGTAVTIGGTEFQTGATVTFDGNPCTNIDVVDDTTITCDTPPGTPGPVDVTVENPDTLSDTLVDGFTYVAPPSIAGVNPGAGPESGGTPVTITGTEFQDGATVTFDGNPCTNIDVVDDTTITCDTPPGTPGPVDVTVENPDTLSDTLVDGFTYLAPPSIAGVSPGAGPESGGTPVNIGGDAFQDGAVVSFGGNPCTGVNVPDESTITCVTPPGPLGPVDVTVENPDGQSDTLIDGFDYLPGEIFDDRFEEL